MPTIADIAICIRSWDFSETSQTVSLFTREHGILRGLAKGAKREKGSFSGGLDVLTRGEVVASVKPGRDLATITAWHLQDVYRFLRKSLQANRAAIYMADLVHHMVIDHDPHPKLFDAFSEAIDALAAPEDTELALLRFQWALLSHTGYQPVLAHNALSGAELPSDSATLAFSPQAGGVVPDTASGDRWRVRRETIELLRRLAAGEMAVSDDAPAVRRASRLLAAYFREIIGSEPPSMRWAFPDLMV